MSKQSKIVTPSDDEVAAYGGGGGAGGEGAAGGPDDESRAADPGIAAEAPAGAETAQRSEADEWRDKYLRARAELANFQKRSEKERSEAMRYAHAELARAMLPIVDDLERLIQNASEGNTSDSARAALVEGVRLTRDNFLKALEKFHVRPIEAQGQAFDPSVHEALMEQPSDQHADHPVVLHEAARGYTLHDRVLRPAKVIVSKSVGVSPGQTEGQS